MPLPAGRLSWGCRATKEQLQGMWMRLPSSCHCRQGTVWQEPAAHVSPQLNWLSLQPTLPSLCCAWCQSSVSQRHPQAQQTGLLQSGPPHFLAAPAVPEPGLVAQAARQAPAPSPQSLLQEVLHLLGGWEQRCAVTGPAEPLTTRRAAVPWQGVITGASPPCRPTVIDCAAARVNSGQTSAYCRTRPSLH